MGEAGRGSAGSWCWLIGMFLASSLTPSSSLHLSGPKSSLKGNDINASPVAPVPGWRGSGLRFLPMADVAAGLRQEEPDAFHPSLV